MSAELLVNVTPRETRVAVIENGVLQELLVDRASRRGLVGNIYKGRVCRVLPGMQAAFVDVGLGRTAFLHASDVAAPQHGCPRTSQTASDAAQTAMVESAPGPDASRETHTPDITELLRQDQELLVQVVKDPMGSKGARLTTHISIPSCYLVYMPNASAIGVSQRIEEESERERLRALVRELTCDPEHVHDQQTLPATATSFEPRPRRFPRNSCEPTWTFSTGSGTPSRSVASTPPRPRWYMRTYRS